MTAQPMRIAPSLLAADLLHLAQDIKAIEAGQADLIHLDIMDGHFVPNLTFGPDVLKQIKTITSLDVDVHLMCEKPETIAPMFIEAGASWVSFHPETCAHPHKLLQDLKQKGVKAGIALNPGTSVCSVEALLPLVDFVLVMSVNPGFCGQAFIESVLGKVEHIKRINPNAIIEMDGGIGAGNIALLYKAGVNVVVAGSSVFPKKDPNQSDAERHNKIVSAIHILRSKAVA
jgi:ribulose-phosphate 3-epimerase